MFGLTSRQLRYFLLRHVLGAGIANFLLNGAMGWIIMLKRADLPLWGMQSIAGDLAGTAFGLSFGTCLIVTVTARNDLRKGLVDALHLSPAVTDTFRKPPHGTFKRSLIFGVGSLFLFAPMAIALLLATGVTDLRPVPFTLLKATYRQGGRVRTGAVESF
jgi:hypothetical protein